MTILSQAARAAMRSALGGQGVANEVERTIVNPQFYGSTFYVHSGRGSDSYGGLSPNQPLATIAAAIAKCTASVGDRVFVMPGHSESISGAGAITPVAGMSIVGFGAGTQRPCITLHTTSTTIAVSAANVTFRNLRIKTDVDAVVKVFNITAAGCTIDAVDFEETASCACLQFVLTTAAADDLTIQNCRWIQSQTAATALSEWIKLIGADRAKIFNNFANIKGFATSNPANGIIVGGTTASLDVEITHNRLVSTNSTGAIPLSLYSGTTGFVTDNRVASAKTAVAGSIALASCYGGENYAAHTANKNGLLDPVVDT
jgi:hypothetical protein